MLLGKHSIKNLSVGTNLAFWAPLDVLACHKMAARLNSKIFFNHLPYVASEMFLLPHITFNNVLLHMHNNVGDAFKREDNVKPYDSGF